MEENFRTQFAGIIWIDDNLEDILKEYDHFEKYSNVKVYSKDIFREIFKGRAYYYRNYLLVHSDQYYVIWKRQKNPCSDFEDYCDCLRCKYCLLFLCPVYTQCLKLGPGYYSEQRLNRAQQKKEDKTSIFSKIYLKLVYLLTIKDLSSINIF